MIRALILIVAGTSVASAQEGFFMPDLARADLVVLGVLQRDFKFPWIDGWNERGHIDVERKLKGSLAQTKLPFAWERDFRPGWCMTRPDWLGAVGKRGIWVLARDGDRYRAQHMFSGFLNVRYLERVSKMLDEAELADR